MSHGPVGRHAFFMGPLYPYALALLRPLVGNSVDGVLRAQALWGSLASVLIADAARRLTRPSVGLAIGVLVALERMTVFFDGLVLMESLLFALEAALLWTAVRLDAPARARGWGLAAAGALIGLLAQGRAVSILLAAPALLLLPAWREPRRAWREAATVALACALACAPSALHNLAVAREWIPFTYNLGCNLYIGNNPEANGSFISITGTHEASRVTGMRADGGADADLRAYLVQAKGLDLSPAASSRYWTRAALDWMRAHPARVARLSARRVGMLWNRREYAQIENVEEFEALARPVGLPLVGGFATLGALALGGALVAWRRGPGARFALGYAAVMTLAIAPFFVTDRYRHHLLPAVALLAALALEALLAARGATGAARAPRAAAGRALAGIVAGIVVVCLPLPGLTAGKTAWGIAADLGTRAMDRGDPQAAVVQFEQALALQASGAAPLGPGNTLALERAVVFHNYARALAALGRTDEALAWRERAVALAPDNATMLRGLADALVMAGRVDSAQALYGRLEHVANGRGQGLAGRGWLAAHAGRIDEARAWFEQAAAADPALDEAWASLVRIAAQRSDAAGARDALERGRRAGWSGPGFDAHAALVEALEGHAGAAAAALARVPPEALAGDPTLAEVARVTRAMIASGR
jgi:tetratricopeptide (TPR) repeat protein